MTQPYDHLALLEDSTWVGGRLHIGFESASKLHMLPSEVQDAVSPYTR